MKFNNHIPYKYLVIIGILLFAAGLSMGYWIRQFDDLEIYPSPDEQFLPNKPNNRDQNSDPIMCAQVITKAKNTTTGSIVEFPTPCDVPVGWTVVR